jgi:hypothetical protein
MSNKHPKLTIRLTELRQDTEYLEMLQGYAMKRHAIAWAERHHKFAEICFAAAERCSRLTRMLTP